MSIQNLSDHQRRYLRGLGHTLKPVVHIGQAGVSDSLIAEAATALEAHELIKIKLRVGAREARDEAIVRLTDALGAALVQRIGNVALIYRQRREKPGIVLPSG